MHPRMNRERKTIAKMIGIYCRHHHGGGEGVLCDDCRQLLDYAMLRLKLCPYQEGKTTCGNCPRHCYKPDRRRGIRLVMGFSGPRMIWLHPLLALGHLADGLRREPKKQK